MDIFTTIAEWLEFAAFVIALASGLANLTPNEERSGPTKLFADAIDVLAGNFNVVGLRPSGRPGRPQPMKPERTQ